MTLRMSRRLLAGIGVAAALTLTRRPDALAYKQSQRSQEELEQALAKYDGQGGARATREFKDVGEADKAGTYQYMASVFPTNEMASDVTQIMAEYMFNNLEEKGDITRLTFPASAGLPSELICLDLVDYFPNTGKGLVISYREYTASYLVAMVSENVDLKKVFLDIYAKTGKRELVSDEVVDIGTGLPVRNVAALIPTTADFPVPVEVTNETIL